jgi:hypothetical protein
MRTALRDVWEKYGGGVREFLWSVVGLELLCVVAFYLDKIGF